ncbi:tetratricopeptide repeat protein [Blastopirellula sp. J2-11]|uniref:tetratricopeptide repeat protein n=1 Tax=Blastopirellula sp. J2-11 TaxID=2943192 RepID=UPI0021C9DAE9|nr:tetratricopeptide repeat protein [Blastopirellula sp. J2-11]UUO07564.1 tetratricopeptide repeat protein [Blastopirellula sp. J2-11]
MKSRLPLLRYVILAVVVAAILSQLFRPALVAQWYWASALEQLEAGDNDAAVRLGETALDWSGDSPEMHLRMAELLYRTGRKEEAIALVEKSEDFAADQLTYLEMEGYLLSRLGQHEKALALADTLVEKANAGEYHLHRALNGRAYATALAWSDGANLPQESLDRALDDINKAMKIYGVEASYLDTRGYVKHFAGDNEGALNDLNSAIELYEASIAKVEQENDDWGTMKQMRLQQMRGALGVLYHHRGETLQALDRDDDASQDMQQAEKLGYGRQVGHW